MCSGDLLAFETRNISPTLDWVKVRMRGVYPVR